jgi:hypothetical protein
VTALRAALLIGLAAAACAGPPGRPLEAGFLAPWIERTEAARDERFRAPVVGRALAPDELAEVLVRELDATFPASELERIGWAGRSIGLLPPGADLRRALFDFAGDGLAGFYSPRRRALFVVSEPRGGLVGRLGPAGSPRLPDPTVMVHELVHALQAQRSELLDLTVVLREHDDLAFALGAVLEGEAVWTAFRDLERRLGIPVTPPDAYAREMSLSWAEEAYPEIPRALRDPILLQYPLGYALVTRWAERGELDALLAQPPLSSEELLHPERDAAGETGVPFLELPDEAPPGCALQHRNTLGELGLRIWLAERRGPESRIAEPAAGWEGDRLAVYSCPGDQAAFLWVLRFETPADARAFEVVASDGLADLRADLVAPPHVERPDATTVVLAAGVDDALRARLLGGMRTRAYRSLADVLADHPELREALDALPRARARPAAAPAAVR